MLKFENCVFSAKGANKNAKVFGLTLTGDEEILVNNCKFDGTGYSAILNKAEAPVTIKNCEFECNNFYNPIEGNQSAANDNVTIDNCNFTGVPGNNFINFYNVAEDSVHTIKNCRFYGGAANNIIRLSNITNAKAEFDIDGCSYLFTTGDINEYSGFMLCQDYTNKSGTKQDFSKYTVKFDNFEVHENDALIYVYEDGRGIIVDNYPATYIDGHPQVWSSAQSPIVEEEEEE